MGKILIIGGGAAGLMAAYSAAARGFDVTVAERNEKVARKVMITGKGRCNVTNATDLKGLINAVTGDGRFLYSAFSSFSAEDTMQFFENAAVPLKIERGNRVFPVSDKAVDIVDALYKTVRSFGVKILNCRIKNLKVSDGVCIGAVTENGTDIIADAVIVATGGLSYPTTGSTGDGYEMAKEVGHSITELKPSLVSLIAENGFCSALSGLSLKNVNVSLYEGENKKPIFTDFGEMLFTHLGVSGPLVLSASAYIENPRQKNYRLEIDLKPALDEKKLDERIRRDFLKFSNKDFINSLNELVPKSMVPVIVNLSGIEPSKKVNQITKEQREKLIFVLKHFTVNIKDLGPIEEAVITKGGISLSEVDPKTMQSKIIKNLHFAGEILDVDAFTGGFNLQIAFSTGYSAGQGVLK